MSTAVKALEAASRRELQALAKELQLCKGNAKSDVILTHAMEYLDSHPKDGEQQVMSALGGEISTPVASPVAKKMTPKKQKEAQPEGEPSLEETTKTTPIKGNKKSPKDKKTKSAVATKASPTAASSASPAKATPKASPSAKKSLTAAKTSTKASPSSKKSPSKPQPAPVEKVIAKKTAPVGKKAEVKARKAVEALVKSLKDLTFVGDSRVRCSTTGHEMKADVDIINAYIKGKRYQKARNLALSFAKYAPMFVDHPDESKTDLLWCNVTESAIARDVKRVKDHMTAPKYQKQLPIWKEEEAAKKKAQEEEAQRRAARIEAAKKRRLEAAKEDGDAEAERPTKRKRTAGVSK
ncbi:hypothetical protein PHMEG_0005208 [Phytophthora megakarya]|uniref:Uncharacterized protein n=1 Tax=Phytophthora megakarya TaxID=4795 RepID=A0A225WRY9_9STRA|nr:hypothetical protein PHMEG_0005208 [Phytophthora megakarya]